METETPADENEMPKPLPGDLPQQTLHTLPAPSSSPPRSQPASSAAASTVSHPVSTPTFGRGVLLVTGALNFGLGVGIPVSLSVMFLDWQDSFGSTRAFTASVHSTCVGILFAGGIIVGFIMNRCGPRITLILGSILATFGILISVFATSVTYLLFSVGIVSGFGFCMVQLPCMPCVTRPFPNHQSMTIAACVIGGSLFNAVLPYFYRFLIDVYGWRGSFIIIGGVSLNTLVIDLIMTSFVTRRAVTTQFELEVSPSNETSKLMNQTDNFTQCQIKAKTSKSPVAVEASTAENSLGSIESGIEASYNLNKNDINYSYTLKGNGGNDVNFHAHDVCSKPVLPDVEIESENKLLVANSNICESEGTKHSQINLPDDNSKAEPLSQRVNISDSDRNIDGKYKEIQVLGSDVDETNQNLGRSSPEKANGNVNQKQENGGAVSMCQLPNGNQSFKQVQRQSYEKTGISFNHDESKELLSKECERQFESLIGAQNGSKDKSSGIISSLRFHRRFIVRLRNSSWRFLLDPLSWAVFLFLAIGLGSFFSTTLLFMDIAKTKGFPELGVELILTAITVGTAGKVLAGGLGLWKGFSSFLLLAASGILGSFGMTGLGNTTSMVGMVVGSAVVGLAVGIIVAVFPKCVLDLPSVDDSSYPLALGLASTTEGLLDFIFPMLIGYAVDVSESYALPLSVLGGAAFFASCVLILVFLWSRHRLKVKVKAKVPEGDVISS